MSTETASDDDNFGTEHSHKVHLHFTYFNLLNVQLISKIII